MPATIKIKNSSTTGAVPTSSDLVQGELAVNVTDLGLYTENASGTVVKLNAPSIDDKNTGATKHLTISTGGNLGLGVTPSAWGSPFKAFQFGSNGGSLNYRTDSNQAVELALNWFYDGTNSKYINSNWATRYRQFSGAHEWYTAASGTAGANITFTQAMTLNANSQLLVGTTTGTDVGRVVSAGVANSYPAFRAETGATTSQQQISFVNPNGIVGTITTSGSATAYNTSSDYRLKNITGSLTGYKERLSALQPKQGSWKVDGSEFRGFLAHEFAESYPSSVHGEKDAVDGQGNPQYQGMQAGSPEVVADLVAYIKELETRLSALEQA